jgi:hypothetical protein
MATQKSDARSTVRTAAKPVTKHAGAKAVAVSVVAVKPKASAAAATAAKSARTSVVKAAPRRPSAAPKSPLKAVSPIVRDSFTMTTADQELLKKCKRDAIATGRESTKKSEVVRAALRHFASLAASTQLMELNSLDPVKTGRPKKK